MKFFSTYITPVRALKRDPLCTEFRDILAKSAEKILPDATAKKHFAELLFGAGEGAVQHKVGRQIKGIVSEEFGHPWLNTDVFAVAQNNGTYTIFAQTRAGIFEKVEYPANPIMIIEVNMHRKNAEIRVIYPEYSIYAEFEMLGKTEHFSIGDVKGFRARMNALAENHGF